MAKTQAGKGKVHLVGAGPGDSGLLTLRGAEVLARAEVVVHDALVHPALLGEVPESAEIIDAGRRNGGGSAFTPEATVALMVEKAKAGRRVVRLKGGDPYVFGRGAEEATGLASAGVEFEVIPGVSSVHAVPAYAGIPLTHRSVASAFTVVSAHEGTDERGNPVDWSGIARTHGTKVVLMGGSRMGAWTSALVAGGMDSATPAAWIESGTTGAQKTVVATLGTLVAAVEGARGEGPGLAVVGEVVRLRERLAWFETRPLFGRRIFVARTVERDGDLARKLAGLGAEVTEIGTVRVAAASAREPMIEALAGLGEYDWIAFHSPHAVRTFFDMLLLAFQDIRAFGNLRIAAVGAATVARVESLRLRVNAKPADGTGKAFADAVEEQESLENLRVLVVRSEVRDPDLARALEERGAIVDDVEFYRLTPETGDAGGGLARLRGQGGDWLIFPDGPAVRYFHACADLPALVARHRGLRVGSMGPETGRVLAEFGVKPAAEARPSTVEGLIGAVVAATRGTPD